MGTRVDEVQPVDRVAGAEEQSGAVEALGLPGASGDRHQSARIRVSTLRLATFGASKGLETP